MRVVHGTDALGPASFRAPVVTLGVFDGVHRGHRRVLARARELARTAAGEVVVVTFHQHPRAVTVGVAPPLITSLDHRLVLLGREGVDAVARFRKEIGALDYNGLATEPEFLGAFNARMDALRRDLALAAIGIPLE